MAKLTEESGWRGSPAGALLGFARQYHLAATTLLPHHAKVQAPIYFLYAHTIELALKAYLRSHGVPLQSKHALGMMLEECQRIGLRVHSDLEFVIRLLESENKLHGFRYFVFKGATKPEIDYVREVVNDLMAAVTEEVGKRPAKIVSRGVLKVTVGKPVKQ